MSDQNANPTFGCSPPEWCQAARVEHMARIVASSSVDWSGDHAVGDEVSPLFDEGGLIMGKGEERYLGPSRGGGNEEKKAYTPEGGHPLEGCFKLEALYGEDKKGRPVGGAWVG